MPCNELWSATVYRRLGVLRTQLLTVRYFAAQSNRLKARDAEGDELQADPDGGTPFVDADEIPEVARAASEEVFPWTSLCSARIDTFSFGCATEGLRQDTDSVSVSSASARRWSSHSPDIPSISLGSIDTPHALYDLGESSPLGQQRMPVVFDNGGFDRAYMLTSK